MKFPTVAVAILLIACGGHKPSARPSMASMNRALAPPTVTSSTTRSVDTSKISDTALSIRIRTVLTTDSTHVERVSLPATVAGIPYGPSELPFDVLCDTTLGYTGTIAGIGRAKWIPVVENGIKVSRQDTVYNNKRNAQITAELDTAAACGGKLSLRISREELRDSIKRTLSVAEALREIRTWPKTWATHPGFMAFHLGDDPADIGWGFTMPVRMVMWDSIACGAKQRFGDKAPLWFRARPLQMEEIRKARPNVPIDKAWECMTTAMAQWVHRLGPPRDYFQEEIASAKRQKLGFVSALNLLNGGCGNLPAIPNKRDACYAAGTTRPGANTGMYQMGTGELDLVGREALADPYVCANISWSWWENFKSPLPDSLQFHNIPANIVVLKNLAKLAKDHPVTNCIQR